MINPEVVNSADENEREGKDCNGGNVVGVSETTNESNLKLIEITWLRIARVSDLKEGSNLSKYCKRQINMLFFFMLKMVLFIHKYDENIIFFWSITILLGGQIQTKLW